MKSIRELKHDQYEYIYKYYSYIARWKPWSYRKVKVIVYVNVCAVLIQLFLKLKIKPNTVTFVYLLMGLLSGIFLSIPSEKAVLTALLLLYVRPFLDWADGPLARELKQTSITGDILDSYGAYVGWAALWVGIGLYLGRTAHHIFYIFSPLLPFFSAVDIYPIARQRFIYHYLSKNELQEYNASYAGTMQGHGDVVGKEPPKSNLVLFKNKIDDIFEHNARTIDLICLLLMIEIIFPVSILWVYYLSFLFWQACVFIMRLLILYRGGWAEAELEKIKNTVNFCIIK